MRDAYKCAVESFHCQRRSRDGIYSAIQPDLLDAKWWRNRGGRGVGLARGKGGSVPDAVLPVGRQAPREWRRSSNWPSASIPTAAAAGHPIRRPNRTSPLVTVEAPVLVSAGSYWLQTRLQEPPLRVPPRTPSTLPSSSLRSSDSPSPCTWYTCCLPRIIRPSSCPTPPGPSPSSLSMAIHRASRKLPTDYLVSGIDKSLLWNDSGRKWS